MTAIKSFLRRGIRIRVREEDMKYGGYETTAAVKVSDCSNRGKVKVELLGSRGQRLGVDFGKFVFVAHQKRGKKVESEQLFGIVQDEWTTPQIKWSRGGHCGNHPYRSVYPGFLKINDNYKYKYYKEKPQD